MKRVYTDERFPGLEIVNEGGTSFSVLRHGQEVSCFESWEKPDGTISEPCAARRAADYFDRLDRCYEAVDPGVPPSSEPVLPKTNLSGQNLSAMIDKLMAQERQEENPERKRFLRQHLLNLMRQEESLVEAVVNHLIEAT